MLLGSQSIIAFFERALSDGRLAGGYCFVGPNQVGKRSTARYIAAQIIGVPVEKLDVHPDFSYYGRARDTKTGKLKRDISVEQARDIRSVLSKRSWTGGKTVLILDEAERLSIEAQNALLKILEEPARQSIIFLLTENDELLLPTIKSRVQLFYISSASEAAIKSALVEEGVDETVAAQAAQLGFGRIGRAFELARDEDKRRAVGAEVERLKHLIGRPFGVKLKEVENIFGEGEDATEDRERLQSILAVWIMAWRGLLHEKNTAFTPERVLGIIDLLQEAREQVGKNVHPRLLVERALLQF